MSRFKFKKINIICIENNIEILQLLVQTLNCFKDNINIYECLSTDDAKDILDNLYESKEPIGLMITDHLMAKQTGLDFIKELYHDIRSYDMKKILISGVVGLKEAALKAKEEYIIDAFIPKPFAPEELTLKVKSLLTMYIMENNLPQKFYRSLLDETILKTWNNKSLNK